MPAHPLYAESSALQEHIDALRGVGWPTVAAEIDRLYDSPVLVPPPAGGGMGGLDRYRDKWLAGEQWGVFGELQGLPGDLQAQLSWEGSRIDREVLRQLQEAAAQESQWLAYLQIEAMMRRQSEVTDQELDLSQSAAEASEKAEQLRNEIIAQAVGAEIEASQARLEELHQALEADRHQSLEEIRDKLQAKAQQRQSYTAAAGHKLYKQLTERIEQFASTIEPLDEPIAGPSPSREVLDQAGQQRQHAADEYDRAVSAQIRRLVARQRTLTAAIEQATRRAVRRIAWENNLDLRLLPGDDKAGDDITALIAEKLAAMWASPILAAQEANSR